MVTADAEIDVRVNGSEIIRHFCQCLFHVIHIFIRLLDYGQCYRPFPVGKGGSGLFLRHDGDACQIFQLEDMVIFPDINILDIFRCAQQCRELDIVLVIAVAYGHATRFDIIGCQCRLQVVERDFRHFQQFHVRNDLQLPFQYPRHIYHRHFGQLFDPTFDHCFGKLAKVEESVVF